jgi:acetyltransferase-like isoleucine patch superfamily enzyme
MPFDMITLTKLENYKDEKNNQIVCDQSITENIKIVFRGSNNKAVIKNGAKIGKLTIDFDCDDGYFEIGSHGRVAAFRAYVRIGERCKVILGDNVSTTGQAVFTVAEHTSITLGNDVMIASDNEIRADDAHPIFDVSTGKRINMPKAIEIGNHVWLAKRAVVLGGTKIGDGSVVGYGSIAKGKFPNNCIIAGIPAKVTKKNIAWERPHLSSATPYLKPDASCVTKSPYWNMTEELLSKAAPIGEALSLEEDTEDTLGRNKG